MRRRSVLGFSLVIAFALLAAAAPLLAPYGATQIRAGSREFDALIAATGEHPLGTTSLGMDVLSRVLWGGQTAFLVVLISVALALISGVVLGLLAGWFGGWLDKTLSAGYDVLYSVPSILLALALSFGITGGRADYLTALIVTAVSVALSYGARFFRLVRGEVLVLKASPFVEAARALGGGSRHLIFRHIAPNVSGALPALIARAAADAIATLAGLGVLGLGIDAGAGAEWGYDLGLAVTAAIAGNYLPLVAPGVAIALLLIGLSLSAEALAANQSRRTTKSVRSARRG